MIDSSPRPAMMHTHPERIRVWPYTASTEQAYDWESSYLAEDRAPIMDREAEYILADIAESRIEKLEAERDVPKIVAHCVATPGAEGVRESAARSMTSDHCNRYTVKRLPS